MTIEHIRKSIEAVLKNHCPSAEVAIVSNIEVGHVNTSPCYYLGISAGKAVEIDKIQAIMTMAGTEFVDWKKDESGDLMIYRVPIIP